MTEKKRVSRSDLQKVEARPFTPGQYDEIPELTEDWFEGAELHVGGVKVQRGPATGRAPGRPQAGEREGREAAGSAEGGAGLAPQVAGPQTRLKMLSLRSRSPCGACGTRKAEDEQR